MKKSEMDGAYGTYGERRSAYRVSVEGPEGKSSLERPRHRWENY
jgi:hypothetical protein